MASNNSKMLKPTKIDVVILCGGEGRRLRSVINDRPKPMAPVRGGPFLKLLISYLAKFGFRRFILCTGYKGHLIKRYNFKADRLEIIFSQENSPLGTAGALKNAESLIKSQDFILLNGDSFLKVNLKSMLDSYSYKRPDILIVVKESKRNADCGMVKLNQSGRIIAFEEKKKARRKCYISAGFYIFSRKMLSLIPKKRKFSLETEFFPYLVKKNKVYGYPTRAAFIDIGTPERYKLTDSFLKKHLP
ncbi:MAG: NTP transferase domain-containing protein [Candidatus Omnitrophica bacterium]|nr:NTP transferase domain-containing protein [Candidatus Omnitrophota bacterium]